MRVILLAFGQRQPSRRSRFARTRACSGHRPTPHSAERCETSREPCADPDWPRHVHGAAVGLSALIVKSEQLGNARRRFERGPSCPIRRDADSEVHAIALDVPGLFGVVSGRRHQRGPGGAVVGVLRPSRAACATRVRTAGSALLPIDAGETPEPTPARAVPPPGYTCLPRGRDGA